MRGQAPGWRFEGLLPLRRVGKARMKVVVHQCLAMRRGGMDIIPGRFAMVQYCMHMQFCVYDHLVMKLVTVSFVDSQHAARKQLHYASCRCRMRTCWQCFSKLGPEIAGHACGQTSHYK